MGDNFYLNEKLSILNEKRKKMSIKNKEAIITNVGFRQKQHC